MAVLVAVRLADDTYVAGPVERPAATVDAGAATATLDRLVEALGEGDVVAASALAPAGDQEASVLLADLARNAARLRVRDLGLRYVDQTGAVTDAGEWRAVADLTWRFAGFDPGPARAEVEVGLRADGGRVAVTGFVGGRVPLWLRGPVLVDRSRGALVLTGGQDPAPYTALARRAVPVVERVLPGQDERLVVEVPSSASELDAVLGVPEGTYAGVAAVTASVDGLLADSAPVHVFVNPDELGRLRRAGAQVVMSHEAVHAVTGAPSSRAPLWLVEGFADYVALRDVDLPLATTAAQVVERVQEDGPPAGLPGEAEFDPSGPHLGAAYEGAWLACREVVEVADEAALVELYRRTSEGEDADAVLRDVAGIGLGALTDRWRDGLADLAARTAGLA